MVKVGDEDPEEEWTDIEGVGSSLEPLEEEGGLGGCEMPGVVGRGRGERGVAVAVLEWKA